MLILYDRLALETRSRIVSGAGLSDTHGLSGLHKNLVDLGDVALCQFLELVAYLNADIEVLD